jgi:hypothetical protein
MSKAKMGPACPHCNGVKFARLARTAITARYAGDVNGPLLARGVAWDVPLEVVMCIGCGKVDLFAHDVARVLERVEHEIVEYAAEGPYR